MFANDERPLATAFRPGTATGEKYFPRRHPFADYLRRCRRVALRCSVS